MMTDDILQSFMPNLILFKTVSCKTSMTAAVAFNSCLILLTFFEGKCNFGRGFPFGHMKRISKISLNFNSCRKPVIRVNHCLGWNMDGNNTPFQSFVGIFFFHMFWFNVINILIIDIDILSWHCCIQHFPPVWAQNNFQVSQFA